MLGSVLLAILLTSGSANGVKLSVEAETSEINPAQSLFLTVKLELPHGVKEELPDLRNRLVGFSLAEDFVELPKTNPDGSTTSVANWRLVPEPVAELYKLKPLATNGFYTPAFTFTPPAPREAVIGEMEIHPTRDFPPLSWKLVGYFSLAALGVAVLFAFLVIGVKSLVRRVKEHRMSPIERAWVELERLLKKGLPGRGYYKDFYVELTLVVRRYIQRKYGIKAPHLTTEEFLATVSASVLAGGAEKLKTFLESADLIKFAGVEATPEMADQATDSARTYLKGDNA